MHVVLDSQFDSNHIIYAGMNNLAGDEGIIYRWTLGKSVNWDELDPLNISFYGLATLNNVFYGAWHQRTEPPPQTAGVDRTLYSRVAVPPPPEWDELIGGLAANVVFTREPTSLHISSNDYNTFWAIDNHPYNLQQYRMPVAIRRFGGQTRPVAHSASTGGLDLARYRLRQGAQMDFKWRPLKDIFGYDVLIAKDVDFTLLLSQVLQADAGG